MARMNKRERLAAAIAGQPVDRPPVALWRHFPGDDRYPEELARAQVEFQKLYDFDFVKVTPSHNFCVADWGVEERYVGNNEGTCETVRRPINGPDDWLKIKPLDPTAGALGRQLRVLELLRDALGDGTPFIQTIFNPPAMVKFLAGERADLAYFRQHPALMKHVLDALTETAAGFVREAIRRGAAGVFMSTMHASYAVMNEAEYREFGRPYDLRVLEAARDGWFNVLHLHGESVMFDLLADYPVQAVNWHDRAGAPSLKDALGRFPGAVIGGLAQWDTLLRGAPPEVQAEARDALEQTGGRRHILGAGCVTPITTPTCNIWAARRAVETFAQK